MRHCELRLSQPLVEKAIETIPSIDISAHEMTASVVFTVRVVFDERSFVYQNFKREMFTKVEAKLQKEQKGRWLINKVEILAIDRQPIRWKDIR